MGFRTIVVNSRCKLEFRLNYLVIRGEKERKIFINEINTLIVQSTAVSLTAALLCELAKNNVKIIFCDEKNNPQTEIIPYYGAHNTSKRYKMQFAWLEETKSKVWQKIVKEKICNQAQILYENGFLSEYEMLKGYARQVQLGDISNREGHSAKVYFNCMMPKGETRRSGGFLNACLNYGYAVLLSAFNREIVACGYLTQLGVWHDNEFNQFNLSCDLMEPLRTIVDSTAFSITFGDEQYKKKMANILNYDACI
ncbi:MAG: type II CRISPR-associated endonuclease Cas1, partial [Candidatus Coproplasma sp.]